MATCVGLRETAHTQVGQLQFNSSKANNYRISKMFYREHCSCKQLRSEIDGNNGSDHEIVDFSKKILTHGNTHHLFGMQMMGIMRNHDDHNGIHG